MTTNVTANDAIADIHTVDIESLGASMIDAARAALADRGSALQVLAEMELRRLAGLLVEIGARLARGEIDQQQARQMADIHRLTVRSVLRSLQGLSLLAVEQTMQAVVGVAGGLLNRIVGFKLL